MRNLISSVFLLWAIHAYPQQERIYIDASKYICHPGDSIFLTGFVYIGDAASPISRTLYVELRSEKSLIKCSKFPVDKGFSAGNLIIPDSLISGNYFLAAYTRQQLNFDSTNFCVVPLAIFNPQKPAPVYKMRQVLSSPSAAFGSMKGITWITNVSGNYLSSLLQIDSSSATRHFQLVMPVSKDSFITANTQLSNSHKESYSKLPVDSATDHAWLLLLEDSNLIARQYIHTRTVQDSLLLHTDTFDISSSGYNAWRLDLPDTAAYYTAITVSDADKSVPSPTSILQLKNSYSDNLTVEDVKADTANISFTGRATRLSGAPLTGLNARELTIAGVRDSSFLFTRLIPIDSAGRFKIDHLNFAGDMELHFQMNRLDDKKAKDVMLQLKRFTPPVIENEYFTAGWEKEPQEMAENECALPQNRATRDELQKMKTLQPFTIKRYRGPRQELDDTYTSGSFSEPALYIYDLRGDSTLYDRNVFLYLQSKGGRLQYNFIKNTMDDVMGHPIHYFLDQQEYAADYIRTLDMRRLAYIKLLENDFLSMHSPTFTVTSDPNGKGPLRMVEQRTALNVCIYTRKDKDFRSMKGGLNKVSIKGYDEILQFHPNETTLSYTNVEGKGQLNIRFKNSATAKRFRLKIEGVSENGRLFHFERVVEGLIPPVVPRIHVSDEPTVRADK